MSMHDTDPRLLHLSADDNVLVLTGAIGAGETVRVAGIAITVHTALSLGHKVAARSIAEGEHVLKYGAPIGIATTAIAPGEHVHVHNVASAYTPSYVLEAPC